jgi:rare lipoprotein A
LKLDDFGADTVHFCLFILCKRISGLYFLTVTFRYGYRYFEKFNLPMKTLRYLLSTLIASCLYTALLFGQQVESGVANYYSDGLNGNPTAYGEVYDRTQFTAAHRNFPKGTLLKVTRLDNNKSVIVRVNDRGPFSSDGAIVSLSMAAASLIDLSLVGHAQVRVEQYGYADNNATAANYNIANGQSSNSYAFDRIYNGTPQDVPQDYFSPRGTEGYNTQQGQNGNLSGNQSFGAQVPQYGPVPPSYDRRFQNRGSSMGPNAGNSQVPPEYGYNGSNYNNGYSNGYTNGYTNGYSNANNNGYNSSNIPSEFSFPNNTASSQNVNPNTIEGFPSLAAGSGYSVQIGSYSVLDNASRQAKSLVGLGLREVYISQGSNTHGPIYKVFKRQFLVNGFVIRL